MKAIFRCPLDEARVLATRDLYWRRESDLNAERVGSCWPVLIWVATSDLSLSNA